MSYSRIAIFAALFSLAGCAETQTPLSEMTSTPTDLDAPSSGNATNTLSSESPATADAALIEFTPLSMNGGSKSAGSSQGSAAIVAVGEERHQAIMENLKPLQVMLGSWRGTTRKEYGISKAVDQHEWVWDLQTNPDQPALSLKSDKSPYLKEARLTWLADTQKFRLHATNLEGVSHEYVGDYTDPVHEVIGEDDKMHRVFRLELTETEESARQGGNETWQVAFVQQQNNRYLLEVDKRRGKAAFRRYDTVSTQREGTSFAVSDSDYGEKTCIISQGLGTIAVSHKGKTYWVCCSGCKAAFEAEPETWIARAEKAAAEK